MSISTPSTIDSQFAISTLPKSTSRSSSSNINSLYEIEYVPGDQLPETTLPLVNPYEYFSKKPSAFSVKGVRQLIRPSSSKRIMEYVQSSKFSSCQVPATEEEQFISLNIPETLPRLWQQQGYTHLHFGVVRIGLTLHARKGLPVIARVALLDSRLKSYQQACIGTVQTTLNAGTIFITLFPNFNVSLQDPNLLKTLKVQLQLIGAPMQDNSVAATLHHQIVYRIQDHALDLVLPSSDEALYLEVTSASQAPNTVQIPRQISRDELIQKIPETWVTSYEKLHQSAQAPIQSADVSFQSRNDGTTEIKFEKPRTSSFRKQLFTQFSIQIDESEFHGPYKDQIPKPISFNQDGSVLYPFKDKNGHQYFDVCSCELCLETSYESDEEIRRRRRSKKDPLYKRYLEGDPTVGTLGDSTGRYDYLVQYSTPKEESQSSIMMLQQNDFPPPEDFTKDQITHSPKIVTRAINSSGPEQLSQGEKVLNWQTENALAQNTLLTTINHKIDQLTDDCTRRLSVLQNSIAEINSRLQILHREMTTMAQQMKVNTSHFRSKELEMANLKIQLKDLQSYLESLTQQATGPTYPHPMSYGAPLYQDAYSPSFLLGGQTQKPRPYSPGFLSSDEALTSRYGMPASSTIRQSRGRRHKEPEFMVKTAKKHHLTPSQSSQESLEEQKQKGKEKDIGIIEFSMSSLLDNLAHTANTPGPSVQTSSLPSDKPEQRRPPIDSVPMISHFSDSDESDEKSLPKQFAIGEGSATPKREPSINEVFSSDDEMDDLNFQGHTSTAKPFASKVMTFTFDDVPFEKWNDRLDEFHAWMTSEAISSTTYLVIQQFTARLSGALKEWWNSLGEYRQQQVLQTTIPMLLGEIHREFIGTPSHLKEQLHEEYFTAKCCSLKRRDLAKHFEHQTRRYYALNGLNNPSLKHVYLSSIDDYLSQQTKLYIRDHSQTVEEVSIGQIQQYVFRTLDKLCKQKEFWTEFMDKSKHLSKICARPDLSIKCSKPKKACSCDSRRKSRRFRGSFNKQSFPKNSRKKFFKKKQGFRKSSRCFLCHHEGHFAKNCPNNSKKKSQYLINSISSMAPDIDLDNHDLESVLSYGSDDKDAICGYSDSDTSSVSSDDEENKCCFKITQSPP